MASWPEVNRGRDNKTGWGGREGWVVGGGGRGGLLYHGLVRRKKQQ